MGNAGSARNGAQRQRFDALFREEPQGALFRSQDEAWAIYSEDFGPCPVRIGTSYQTINEG